MWRLSEVVAHLTDALHARAVAGAVTSSALFKAQGGVQLNSTLLDESYLQALVPPVCAAPGGDRLQFTNASVWLCVCVAGWSGASCAVPPPAGYAAPSMDVAALSALVVNLTAQVAALQTSVALLVGRMPPVRLTP